MTHYHIHWSKGLLDWECFNLAAEAEAAAQMLVLPAETYRIEEYDEQCPECLKLRMKCGRGTARGAAA